MSKESKQQIKINGLSELVHYSARVDSLPLITTQGLQVQSLQEAVMTQCDQHTNEITSS